MKKHFLEYGGKAYRSGYHKNPIGSHARASQESSAKGGYSIDERKLARKLRILGGMMRKTIAGAFCFLASFSLTFLVVFYATTKLNVPLAPALAIAFSSVGIMPLIIRIVFDDRSEDKYDGPIESFA